MLKPLHIISFIHSCVESTSLTSFGYGSVCGDVRLIVVVAARMIHIKVCARSTEIL